MIEDAPLLTKTVKINQSEGIPGSGIPERTFVKNSYKRSRTSLPSPPLLFIAFFTSHRSPLSERLEQATKRLKLQTTGYRPGPKQGSKIPGPPDETSITLPSSFNGKRVVFWLTKKGRGGPSPVVKASISNHSSTLTQGFEGEQTSSVRFME